MITDEIKYWYEHPANNIGNKEGVDDTIDITIIGALTSQVIYPIGASFRHGFEAQVHKRNEKPEPVQVDEHTHELDSNVTYDHISKFIDEIDPDFDPSMKIGKPITRRSRKLNKDLENNKKIIDAVIKS